MNDGKHRVGGEDETSFAASSGIIETRPLSLVAFALIMK